MFTITGDEWISIHSLRVEGDVILPDSVTAIAEFQSTPSVWRETERSKRFIPKKAFQSTPSVWRETVDRREKNPHIVISIHSLRVEGDRRCFGLFSQLQNFNPLPPCGGRPDEF